MLDPVTRGFISLRPAVAAQTVARLDDADIHAILEAMPRQLAASMLEHMAPGAASHCLGLLPKKTMGEILSHASIQTAVASLRLMKREQINELYRYMPQTRAARLRLRLRYSETVIGAHIDSDAVTFNLDHRVGDALRVYRREGQRTGHIIHVLDERRHVAGIVSLGDLLSARDRSSIKNIMQPPVDVLHTRAALHSAANNPAWLTHESLAVVNRDGVFQGVLRRNRVMNEEQQLLNEVTGQNENAMTRTALSDIFWIAMGSLFAGRVSSDTRNKVED